MTLTFCNQNGNRNAQQSVYQNVNQHPSGKIASPNLLTGSAEFSTGGYRFCYVTLTNIPDYSWCGVYITKLQLSYGDKLQIQSGMSGFLVEMKEETHQNTYYIPTLNGTLTSGNQINQIQFQFKPASLDVGYQSPSNIELLYRGKCHCYQCFQYQFNLYHTFRSHIF